MIDASYWFMFPIGVGIGTIAMMFGIGGAVFFAPLFFIVLKLRPDLAIGTGIFIEIFGFGSGLIGYARKKMINFRLGKRILVFSIPAAIAGTLVRSLIPGEDLLLFFGIGMVVLGFSILGKEKEQLVKDERYHKACFGWIGHRKCYTVAHADEPVYMLSALGGLSLGLISAGLGEINEYNFLKKLKMHTGIASGTSVFIVMITALIASASHFIYLFGHGNSLLAGTLSILIFTIPGVIIGGQFGVHLASRVSNSFSKKALFFILFFIGILSIIEAV